MLFNAPLDSLFFRHKIPLLIQSKILNYLRKQIIQYMKAKLKSIGSDFKTLWALTREDKSRHNRISFMQKIIAWKSGFLPDSFLMYDIKNKKRNHYLTDFYRYRYGQNINGHFNAVLNDKFLFNKVFDDPHLIKPVLTQVNGVIRDADDGYIGGPMALINALGKGNFVMKPSLGGGGKGIKFIKIDEAINVDGVAVDECGLWNELVRYRISIVDRYVEQTGFAHEIYPDSVNTIRMLTMFDHTAGKSFLAHATFRCGTSKSGKVDNWTSGGISISLDKDFGILGRGATFPSKGKLEWFSGHPDTQVQFDGVMVPNWHTMVDEVLDLANRYSYIPYIGWDIIPMEGGYFILEANSNSGINFLQIHYPLLDNPRIKSFYSRYGKI